MKKYKELFINVVIILLGNFMLALAVSFFVLPFDIDMGGLSGISVILKKYYDPVTVIFIINWFLFAVGAIFLKKEFALKTLLSTIVYPLFLELLYKSDIYLSVISEVNDALLASILAGGLTGLGLGLVYRVGGSTGGLDVVSLLVNKYLKVKISIVTFIVDFLIILIGLFTISINSCLYGIIAVTITSFLIETITITMNKSYMMHIISDKYEDIKTYIIDSLNRGCTTLEISGGYKNEKKIMIEVIFSQKEYYKIKHQIKMIDNKAFISIYKTFGVYGEGFKD